MGLDASVSVAEEKFGCRLPEEVGVCPSGDGVVDCDFVCGEVEGGENGLGVIEAIIRDIVGDQALF